MAFNCGFQIKLLTSYVGDRNIIRYKKYFPQEIQVGGLYVCIGFFAYKHEKTIFFLW